MSLLAWPCSKPFSAANSDISMLFGLIVCRANEFVFRVNSCVCVCVCVCVCTRVLSCIWLFVTSWTVIHQAPLSTKFPRQEYWSGLPSPGNLPEPEIRPCLLHLLHWQANSLPHLGMFSNTFNWAEAYMTILTEFSFCQTLCWAASSDFPTILQ